MLPVFILTVGSSSIKCPLMSARPQNASRCYWKAFSVTLGGPVGPHLLIQLPVGFCIHGGPGTDSACPICLLFLKDTGDGCSVSLAYVIIMQQVEQYMKKSCDCT